MKRDRLTAKEVALVDDLALAHLQLRAQLAQLLLVLAQQRALVRILVYSAPCCARSWPDAQTSACSPSLQPSQN